MTDRSAEHEPHVPGLAVAWSRDEPERIGEVVLLPTNEPGAAFTFGRDTVPGDSRSRALGLARQRPGATVASRPLSCPRISRAQLRLSVGATGALVVENVGRCPLLRGDAEVSRVELLPGDVVELRHELVLVCVRRPRELLALPGGGSLRLHPFGAPDAFGLVGEAPAIWELRMAISALAPLSAHVLVLGPSGAGKELVAHAIHDESPRRERPFVARNAATIPEGIADAELFGHARSYPNSGAPERAGLVGEAAGGTLFLDELGELPLHVQAHLLRVLDGGEYHRLGESRARRADLRLIGATNRPESALKHDVLARFQARVHVPALRERREDVPLLAAHLLRRQAASNPAIVARFFPDGDPHAFPRMTPDLAAALLSHDYHAHVRELDALLLRATIESRGRYLERTEGVCRLLASPPPQGARPSDPGAISPAPAPSAEPFTSEEQRRLALQRKHGFRAADCGLDPEYGVNRQTADLHLRQLMSRALAMSGWDVERACSLLAGAEAPRRAAVRRRISTFVFNLQKRLDLQGSEALRAALSAEWRASAPSALRLLDAIEAGRLGRETAVAGDLE